MPHNPGITEVPLSSLNRFSPVVFFNFIKSTIIPIPVYKLPTCSNGVLFWTVDLCIGWQGSNNPVQLLVRAIEAYFIAFILFLIL